MIVSQVRALAQHWDHCSLPQMYKEDVEHAEYEDLVRQINTDRRYDYLFTTNKPVQQASFGHYGNSARMSE